MNQVLAGLERGGLVVRAQDPDHGRIVRLDLSHRGRSVLSGCDERVDALEADMLAGLGEPERELLGRAVRIATDNLRDRYQAT